MQDNLLTWFVASPHGHLCLRRSEAKFARKSSKGRMFRNLDIKEIKENKSSHFLEL